MAARKLASAGSGTPPHIPDLGAVVLGLDLDIHLVEEPLYRIHLSVRDGHLDPYAVDPLLRRKRLEYEFDPTRVGTGPSPLKRDQVQC